MVQLGNCIVSNAKTINFDSFTATITSHLIIYVYCISCNGHRYGIVGSNESSTYTDVSGFIEKSKKHVRSYIFQKPNEREM